MSKDGICCDCGEWTTVNESCCGAGVFFEGDIVFDKENDCECFGKDKCDFTQMHSE